MRIRRTSQRLAVAALVALAVTALPSCGGGGDGGGGGTNAPTATFTPDNPSPGTSTIAMLAGASAGAAVNVRITVTGVNDFFGAAFRVTYDPVALLFNGMDDSGSLLRQGGVTNANLVFQANQTAVPGQIIITATRLDPTTAGTVDVGPTADLVVLNFSARRAIAAGDAGGVLDFDASRDVQVCATPLTCASAGGLTWSGGAVTAQ
jgi:hypothetical protein